MTLILHKFKPFFICPIGAQIMRTVTITISDEFGNVTNDPPKNTYQLDLETEGFEAIEKASVGWVEASRKPTIFQLIR